MDIREVELTYSQILGLWDVAMKIGPYGGSLRIHDVDNYGTIIAFCDEVPTERFWAVPKTGGARRIKDPRFQL